MFDLTIYSQWVQATVTKQQKHVAYIQERLIEDFAVASDVGRADTMKENYSILILLLALVLFFTAVPKRKLAGWAPWVLLALAFVARVGASRTMLTFPALI